MVWHISSNNKNIIQEPKKSQHPNPKTCDCPVAENCPLNGICKESAVICQADVTPEIDNERIYIGLTEGPFKERLSDLHTSFNYEQYKNKSKLSSFIWETKNKGLNFKIKWSVIRDSTPFKAGSKKWNFCLWEIPYHERRYNDKVLNELNELTTKCRHADTFLLKHYKSRRRRRGRERGRGW